jgi:hypothetical protein
MERSRPATGGTPETGESGSIAPEDSFLVQIRGGSRPADEAVRGRIEHLYTGVSEPFETLAELLDFLGRYFGRPAPGSGEPAT